MAIELRKLVDDDPIMAGETLDRRLHLVGSFLWARGLPAPTAEEWADKAGKLFTEPSVAEVIEWLEQQGVGFKLALCRFTGGEWVFHAIDEPADGEATHFAIALGGDE